MILNKEELDENQKAALNKFKEQVQSNLKDHHDDHFLIKWLQATDFDAQKAEDMFRQSLWIRKKFDLDSVLSSYHPPEVLLKYDPGGFYGYDKEGSPIFVDPLGQVDFRGILHSAKKEQVLKFKGYRAELGLKMAREKSKELNKPVCQVTCIIDMEGFGLKHLWGPGIDLFNNVLTMYEHNFPGYWKRIFVIKASSIVPTGYSLCKPFLSEYTKDRIKIFGADWKEKLQKYIDVDNLPEYYGGTGCDENDPKCSSKICYGGIIPESYYLAKKPFGQADGSTVATVDRGKKLEIVKEIETPGSILSWEFRTQEHDIGFGIFLCSPTLDDQDDMDDVLPIQRVNSHLSPEIGSFECECSGKYVIRFDNTYSWVRKKTVEYSIDISIPSEGKPDQKQQ
ncbi:SEC14-like protein 2 [Exaiptasia diaphana]|uniref:SEC14-like protein 2 n=1 Tax=Exaiptasia diaphana TaxID=2652724 RepID=A0A913Y616_EXADI|nr:SEC14-like protein 2 [Exaiptasia diaphana]KXJ29102.1 SEC14-like protein 2 [Exaiptasia diaphana]